MQTKVLIIFETFHSKSGGGITLTNLFKDWDSFLIANCTNSLALKNNIDNSICSNYYALGDKEISSPFPVSLFVNWGISGPISQNTITSDFITEGNVTTIIPKWIKVKINLIFKFLGIKNNIYSVTFSKELLVWIDAFQPDIIYAQPGNIACCLFIEKLIKRSNTPVILHVMDDWISLEKKGIFNWFTKDTTLNVFTRIIKSAAGLLTISEGMQKEYKRRFEKDSEVFHNTLDLDKWIPYSKKNYEIGETTKILYAGRIGVGVYHSLLEFIDTVKDLISTGMNIEIYIQTPKLDEKYRQLLSNYQFVIINKFAEYSKLPEIFSSYDIIILPIDFDEKGKTYLKYSMPTKVPEFMISGTPILMYAPNDIYIHKNAVQYKWAHVIKGITKSDIKTGLCEILGDKKLREYVSTNAKNYALQKYDGETNRKRFKEAIIRYQNSSQII